MISVLILTKNEANDLPACLASINWCDDIHVFDSFSDDGTPEIAKSLGANLTQRKFDGYASQRNAALHSIAFKYPWVLILDADEQIPQPLFTEMQKALCKVNEETSAFRVRRKDYLFNKWLKHAQISPFYIRLVRPDKVRYHREINEVLEVQGEIDDLNEAFNHYPFSKGIKHWLDKHNVYSTLEAKRWIEEQDGNVKFSLLRAITDKDFNTRRFHQKGLFYKVPARPLVKWLYMVCWRRAFLDGIPGITYATLQSIYEYFIVLKTKELQERLTTPPKSSTHLLPQLTKAS